MTREQRNVLAELIVAALHDERADAALRALARVTDAAAIIDAGAASRLVAAGLVVVEPTLPTAGGAAAPSAGQGAKVRVTLAPAFASIRTEVTERVRRAVMASDAYRRDRRPTAASASAGGAVRDLAGCLHRSAALFDAGLYFEVHEELEALWRDVRGETRIVVQGLLQIAVALHHAEHGNVAGARRLLAAGREKIAPHAPVWNGVAVAALLAELERFETTCLDRGEPTPAPRLIVAG